MPFLHMSNDSPTKAPWHLLIAASLAILMLLAVSVAAPRPASAGADKAVADGCAACVLTAERIAGDIRKPGDQVKRLNRKVNRKVKHAAIRAKRKHRRDKIRAHAAEKRDGIHKVRHKDRLKGKVKRAEMTAKRREKVARIREARRARGQEFRRDWNNLAPKEE